MGPGGGALPPGAVGERLRAARGDRVRRRGRRRPVRLQADRPRRPARRLADRRRLGRRPAAEAGPRPHLSHHGLRTARAPHGAATGGRRDREARSPGSTRRATPSGARPRCASNAAGARRSPPCATRSARRRIGVRGRLHAVWVLAHVGRAGRDRRTRGAGPVRSRPARPGPGRPRRGGPGRPGARAASPGERAGRRRPGRAAGRPRRRPRPARRAGSRRSRSAGCAGPGAPAWLRRTLEQPDPALAHAAMQALRRSANWPAVLALLDEPDAEPMRALALRAHRRPRRARGRRRPDRPPGGRTGPGPSSPVRRRCWPASTRSRGRGSTGDTARPRARRTRSPGNGPRRSPRRSIGRWTTPTTHVRLAVLRRMIREKVATRLATLRAPAACPARGRKPWPRSSSRCATTPPTSGATCWPTIVADRSHTPANRLAALALWPGGDEGTRPGEAARAGRRARRRPGARRGDPSHQQAVPARAAPLLVRALGSPDPDVRAAAVEVAAALGVADAGERVRELARGSGSGRAPGGRGGRGRAGPEGGGRPAPRPRPRPRPGRAARRPRFAATPARAPGRAAGRRARSPIARRSSPHWRASPSWAGPPRPRRWPTWRSGAPLRRSSPSRCRILTDWGRRAGPAHGRTARARSGRGRGAGGDRADGPLAGDRADPPRGGRLARRPGRTGPAGPSSRRPGTPARWQTLFATGTEARLRVQDGAGPKPGSVCLGATDFTLPEPATVQLLASSNGTLRIWADGKLVHQRSEARPFQPDSDRVRGRPRRGPAPPRRRGRLRPAPPEFHLRFRRKGSSLEHERLVQMALTRAGDPERGRKVLEDVEKSLCLKCHRVGDRGERIGPELSGLGGRFSRITIVESILEPSRSDRARLRVGDGGPRRRPGAQRGPRGGDGTDPHARRPGGATARRSPRRTSRRGRGSRRARCPTAWRSGSPPRNSST